MPRCRISTGLDGEKSTCTCGAVRAKEFLFSIRSHAPPQLLPYKASRPCECDLGNRNANDDNDEKSTETTRVHSTHQDERNRIYLAENKIKRRNSLDTAGASR